MPKLYSLIIFGFILFPMVMHSQTEEQVEEWFELGCDAYQKENYSDAIYYFERCHDEFVEMGIKNDKHGYLLAVLAERYSYFGNYNKAIEYGCQALEIRKEILGDRHPHYLTSLNNLASYYYGFGNYSKAVELGSQALEIGNEILGEKNLSYANFMDNLALYYSLLGNYNKSIELCSQALEIRKEILGEEHPDYALSLNNLASYYAHLGDYNKAILLGNQALEITKEILGKEHPNYATCLNNLADYYSNLGDYSKAIELGSQALEIRKKIFGEKHPDYVTSLNNLANYISYLGDYSKAIELGSQALEIRKEILGEHHPNYATSLNNLASDYFDIGDYTKAIDYGSQALEITKEVLGEEHPNYATCLNNLANYYSILGGYSKAVELIMQALDIRKVVLGKEHPDYATSLNNLAILYSNFGDYSGALFFGNQALEITKEVLGEEHPNYATCLNNLADYYSNLGDYSKAIEFGSQALEIRKEKLGEEHQDHITSLYNLGGFYFDLGFYPKAVNYCQKSLEILSPIILHQFSSLSGGQRESFWSKHKYWFTEKYPSYSFLSLFPIYSKAGSINHSMKQLIGLIFILIALFMLLWLLYNYFKGLNNIRWKWSLAFIGLASGFMLIALNRTKGDKGENFPETEQIPIGDLYDKSALFAKGLLLTTEIEMNKLIQESGDKEALNMFEELKQKGLMLQKLYEKPIAERILNTDSLEQEADKLESELVKRSKVYGDFSRKLRTTWKDVQAALNEDEMAVEFLSFGVGSDSTMVVALTLRKDNKEPKMIPLFEQKQLEKVKDIKISHDRGVRKTKTFYSQEVTDLVWKPMAEEFKGIKRIYFSAAGILHKVGIEYAPGMEDYDMCRLSTTREVIDMKENSRKSLTAQSDAILYGGVDYEVLGKSKAQKAETKNGQKNEDDTHRSISIDLHHAFIDSLKVRGTDLKYLPGTLDEVKHISSCFDQKHRRAITGTDATETSVKSLPEKLPRILHIATHGFYYTEKEKARMDVRKGLLLDNEHRLAGRHEDEALNRSGLFMAGANRALKGEPLPMEADDGILTAQEIAKIDLRGVDLVVLSACETGQGDIYQGEGVYGLQRGFKKAGVNTIMMSLWKVSDKATEILMTEFYKQVCAGQSKHEALRMAQKKVREYKNHEGKQQFEDPFFWAGFILLD